MLYDEEDTCHMRRRIHACHMRRRIHAYCPAYIHVHTTGWLKEVPTKGFVSH
jgi:hypothetical protein